MQNILSERTLIKDMTTGNPVKQLLVFSLPFMLSNLLQQAYTLADMVIVGRFVGSVGLAAASNAGDIIAMFFFVCLGFTSAGQIIVSQHIGAGNRDRLQQSIGTLLTFVLLLGLAFTVVPPLVAKQLLNLVNIPEESYADAMDYILVCCAGNLPVFGYNAISAVLRGMGDSKHPMIFVMIASISNIFLDLLFVGPLGMGCFGAALATVMSQCGAFIASVVFAYTHRDSFGFDFKLKSFRMEKSEMKMLLSLGVPMAIQNFAVNISMIFVNSMINVYGVTAAAVTAVGNKLTILASICCGALSTAGSTVIGQNFAAKKFKRVGQTILIILVFGMAFVLLLSAVVAMFPEQIFGLFDSEPEVLEMSHIYAPIAVINLIGFAVRGPFIAFINGIGYSALAFTSGILDGLVMRVGLSVLFGKWLDMGIFGLWLGSALAGYTFLFIGGIYFMTGQWKKREPIVAKMRS